MRYAAAVAAAAALAIVLLTARATAARELAITFDDFDLSDTTKLDADQRNDAILAELAKRGLTAALFVSCKNLRTPDDLRRLQAWADAGHAIGNHTWSHKYFGPKLSVREAADDIAKCDAKLTKVKGYERRFRYPFLAEGDTPAKRDALRSWLSKHHYASGAVTLDASDWYVDQRLRELFAKDPAASSGPLRSFYSAHILERASYYDGLAKEVLGRDVKHTLLLHTNLLAALHLGDLLTSLEQSGWKLIDAKTAFQDPIFDAPVDVMPAGQSIIWAHAKKAGKPVRYPGEDGAYEKDSIDAIMVRADRP